ncbi:MAG: glutamate--tRNA ligase [Candidatus Neomarinimicrobiota bacterium]|nr:MAG: glutamate--tRNA ligase [Candidatus Neomarinimicrobiota bacterium]
MKKQVRVRFAPSPTGDFHVGGARTALYNYLFARREGGQFILRIEDTDRKRYHPDALTWLLDGLRYLGLEWDEGPGKGGNAGPYVQSERLEIYRKQVNRLLESGTAYRCFCTPERLQEVIAAQKRNHSTFIGYDRHCRDLSREEVQAQVQKGTPSVIRFKMPREGETVVEDRIRGNISFSNRELQDVVLLKSDGYPTYHLANVIDDHLMGITHILRGDEWINSLPIHAQLYRAFGWEMPAMVHLPVILNPSGKGKMSKRGERAPDGSVRPVFVRQFKELGYLPEALVNFLVLVGWAPESDQEEFTLKELIHTFSLERIHTSPAVWNYDKLEQFNARWIRRLEPEELARRILPYLESAGIRTTAKEILPMISLIRERITLLSQAPQWLEFFFQAPRDIPRERFIPKKGALNEARQFLDIQRTLLTSLDFQHQVLYTSLKTKAQELKVKAGVFFHPLRVAVCGKTVAPPLFESMEILGREEVCARVDRALQWIRSKTNE